MSPIPDFTNLPTTPVPGTPSFEADVDAWVPAFSTFAAEMAVAVPQFNNVTAQANSAIAAVDATQWTSGETISEGDGRWSPTDYQSYRARNAISSGANTTDPAADGGINWEKLSANVANSVAIILSDRASNTAIGNDDKGDTIRVTSGTFTQTFDAVSTLDSDWSVIFWNDGTGLVTLDPDGAETIDGLADYIVYPGEKRVIFADGGNLASIVLNPFDKYEYLSSGTFTMPPGYRGVHVRAFGGGGGGAGAVNVNNGGGGGGGGACADIDLLGSVAAGEDVTVTIGAGGTGRSGSTDGDDGGSTLFGAYVYAGGGAGGHDSYGHGGAGGSVGHESTNQNTQSVVYAGTTNDNLARFGANNASYIYASCGFGPLGGGGGRYDSANGGWGGFAEWGGGGGGGPTVSNDTSGGAGGDSQYGGGGGAGGAGATSSTSRAGGALGHEEIDYNNIGNQNGPYAATGNGDDSPHGWGGEGGSGGDVNTPGGDGGFPSGGGGGAGYSQAGGDGGDGNCFVWGIL